MTVPPPDDADSASSLPARSTSPTPSASLLAKLLPHRQLARLSLGYYTANRGLNFVTFMSTPRFQSTGVPVCSSVDMPPVILRTTSSDPALHLKAKEHADPQPSASDPSSSAQHVDWVMEGVSGDQTPDQAVRSVDGPVSRGLDRPSTGTSASTGTNTSTSTSMSTTRRRRLPLQTYTRLPTRRTIIPLPRQNGPRSTTTPSAMPFDYSNSAITPSTHPLPPSSPPPASLSAHSQSPNPSPATSSPLQDASIVQNASNGSEHASNGTESASNGMESVSNGMESASNGVENASNSTEITSNGIGMEIPARPLRSILVKQLASMEDEVNEPLVDIEHDNSEVPRPVPASATLRQQRQHSRHDQVLKYRARVDREDRDARRRARNQPKPQPQSDPNTPRETPSKRVRFKLNKNTVRTLPRIE
ncbi:hypothetical protein BC940DRAFT_307877 [Gongronella butleri]|nr:hypothetical protein BC940DRAFT_307877 [Gongronella butleri]